MKVFKFGGGILHSAENVKRIPSIINLFQNESLLLVISAFGKTTNALEELIRANSEDKSAGELLAGIQDYHREIIVGLFPVTSHPVYHEVQQLWKELEKLLKAGKPVNPAEYYDRIICFGELASSRIVSHYLKDLGIANNWTDVRQILKTDSTFGEAQVDWKTSRELCLKKIRPLLLPAGGKKGMVVTQGFIGSDGTGRSTSLGREGSDYTASIFASLLDAGEVIIWKDVPGILNADPKHFRQTIKLDCISYSEATELAYYGAKVLHPKTIKPLQNKGIPLQVRSFYSPTSPGTLIQEGLEADNTIPNFIFKFEQVLISVSTRDLSFIDEKVFNDVFGLLSQYSIHLNIIQNSALTLSFCIDHHPAIEAFIGKLQEKYPVRYNRGLELITIRHYNDKAAALVLQGKEVLLEQQNRTVVQYVVR
jgi:aspartate kinase